MSLLEEVKGVVEDLGNAPAEEYYNHDLLYNTCVLVRDVEDDFYSLATVREAVFLRGEEYVGVLYFEPATAMQNWGDWDASQVEVYPVEPYEVVETKFRRI